MDEYIRMRKLRWSSADRCSELQAIAWKPACSAEQSGHLEL